MWRSFFLGFGAYITLLGMEALAVEKAVLKPEMVGEDKFIKSQEVVPPDWAPWTLMGAGAVTVLYSFTIPNGSPKINSSSALSCKKGNVADSVRLQNLKGTLGPPKNTCFSASNHLS